LKPTDEISSTEKLLDLIQKGGDSKDENSHFYSSKPKPVKKFKNRFYINRFLKKTDRIGIHFGYRDIRLIKIRLESESSWKILEYRNEPLDFQVHRESREFTDSLKRILIDFCGSPESSEIWCLMSSANVEIRNIRIPKVPKNQIANVVNWTIKKELKLDEENSILDFEIRGDVNDDGIPKTAVMACIAPRSEVNELKNLFYGAGFPLCGISIASFAIQNLFRTGFISTENENAGNLFIGEDWSRVDIFSSGNLALTRNIKTGINGIIETLSDYLHDKYEEGSFDSSGSPEVLQRINAEAGELSNEMRSKSILLSLCLDMGKSDAIFPGMEVKEAEVFDVILPPLDRLIRQMERSFEHHALFLKNGEMNRIFLAGEIYAHKDLDKYIGEQVGIQTEMIDPLAPGNTVFKSGPVPDYVIDRACYAPAFGIALSNNSQTPNFLYTYEEKEARERVSRVNRLVTSIFILLSVISIVFFLYQGYLIERKAVDVKSLRYELEKYSPRVNLDTVTQLVTREKEKQNALKEYAKRYLGLAIIGELSNLTPPEIRLLNVNVLLSDIHNRKSGAVGKRMTVEGSVSENDSALESSLAEYILSLENSPLFIQPVIIKSDRESLDGEETLMFILKLAIDLDF